MVLTLTLTLTLLLSLYSFLIPSILVPLNENLNIFSCACFNSLTFKINYCSMFYSSLNTILTYLVTLLRQIQNNHLMSYDLNIQGQMLQLYCYSCSVKNVAHSYINTTSLPILSHICHSLTVASITL